MKKCTLKAINEKTAQVEQFDFVVASAKSLHGYIRELEENGYIVKTTSVKDVDFFVDEEIMVDINNVLANHCEQCEDSNTKELVSDAIRNALLTACIFYKESKRKSK